jgi:hypothetical protein
LERRTVSLPNYLVIGAQRSGTTWLHELLGSHPRVYVPSRRKEIKYFSRFYDRGPDWYRGYFPKEDDAGRYDAIGEVTPTYLYKREVPDRIRQSLPNVRLLVILRNPADRAFSHYLMWVRSNNYRKSFEELLTENKGVFRYGLYGMWISRYLEVFDREALGVLIYEDAVRNVDETKRRVAEFLRTDAREFPPEGGRKRVGGSYVPRARWAYAASKRAGRWLQRKDMNWAVNLAKRSGATKMLGKRKQLPTLAEGTRAELLVRYQEDIALLEGLLDLDLSHWKS